MNIWNIRWSGSCQQSCDARLKGLCYSRSVFLSFRSVHICEGFRSMKSNCVSPENTWYSFRTPFFPKLIQLPGRLLESNELHRPNRFFLPNSTKSEDYEWHCDTRDPKRPQPIFVAGFGLFEVSAGLFQRFDGTHDQVSLFRLDFFSVHPSPGS